MLYQIPHKTTTTPKWLTATLIMIYALVTALLFINGSDKPKQPAVKTTYTHAQHADNAAYTKTKTSAILITTN